MIPISAQFDPKAGACWNLFIPAFRSPFMSISSQFCVYWHMLEAWNWPWWEYFIPHKLANTVYQGFLESWVLIYEHTIAPTCFPRFISHPTFPVKSLPCSFHSFFHYLSLLILGLCSICSICQERSPPTPGPYLSMKIRSKSNPSSMNVTRYPSQPPTWNVSLPLYSQSPFPSDKSK